MIREATGRGATIDEAIDAAAKALGVDVADCSVEILETPKRSLFGKNRDAVVKATIEAEGEIEAKPVKDTKPKSADTPQQAKGDVAKKIEVAQAYLRDILDGMGLNSVEMTVEQTSEGAKIDFEGDGMAVLIGHHGDTLDALQYLVALTCNRIDNEYCRITLDCGNYRSKREETLKGLAGRIASKVKKTGRSQTLEPMNPYERRIIHAVVSEIDGVFSKSNGEEPNRRVVILSETPAKSGYSNNNKYSGGKQQRGGKQPYKPYVHKPEPTMEEILKSDFKEKEKNAELYSKIEL